MPAGKGVLVIGSANVDLVVCVPHLPKAGETVTGGTFQQAMGGKGANQAVAARRAGAEVTFVISVGLDEYGRQVLEAMRTEGIDLRGTRTIDKLPTGVALILVDEAGQNSIAVAPGANFALGPADLVDTLRAIASFRLVVVQNELREDTLRAILNAARVAEVDVLLNYAPAGSIAVAGLVGARTGLVVNEGEASVLLGDTIQTVGDAAKCALQLHSHGFAFVIITLGSKGCCVATSTENFHMSSMPVRVADTTAAGDTFCGALAAALAGEVPLRKAVRFATAAAGLAATKAAAQPSIPSRAEIHAALAAWIEPSV